MDIERQKNAADRRKETRKPYPHPLAWRKKPCVGCHCYEHSDCFLLAGAAAKRASPCKAEKYSELPPIHLFTSSYGNPRPHQLRRPVLFLELGQKLWLQVTMGRGGALVKSMTLNRRVEGSSPALAATSGPWASPLLTVACALQRETPIQYPCCSRDLVFFKY